MSYVTHTDHETCKNCNCHYLVGSQSSRELYGVPVLGTRCENCGCQHPSAQYK